MGSVVPPDIQAKIVRLKTEYPYFAEKLLKVKPKQPGALLPFIFNRAQRYVHEKLEEQRAAIGMVRALILKGRQQGISTYIQGRGYHQTAFRVGRGAFILTHEDKATKNLFEITHRYHENVDSRLRPETRAANGYELAFTIGSNYGVGTAKTKDTGRSFTFQFFHGSEVAFWDNAKDHMAGVGQAVPDAPDTEIILESTGNGIGNEFHSRWEDAVRGRSRYIAIFVPWFWQEEYRTPVPAGFVLDADEAEYAELYAVPLECMVWRRNKLQDDFRGDVELFDQEYPATPTLAFRRGSSLSYVPLGLVERAMATKLLEDESHLPKIMGLDPAEDGEDDTALARRQGRRGFPFKRRHGLEPMQVVGWAAHEADAWAKEDGVPVDAIVVDATGIGSGIASRLAELEYPVIRVHFGEDAIEKDIYHRRKDELYALGKQWLEDKPNQLPQDEIFKVDATATRHDYDGNRRLIMEPKKQMKKRGLKSPDSWDAWVLTFAATYGPRKPKAGKKVVRDWRLV